MPHPTCGLHVTSFLKRTRPSFTTSSFALSSSLFQKLTSAPSMATTSPGPITSPICTEFDTNNFRQICNRTPCVAYHQGLSCEHDCQYSHDGPFKLLNEVQGATQKSPIFSITNASVQTLNAPGAEPDARFQGDAKPQTSVHLGSYAWMQNETAPMLDIPGSYLMCTFTHGIALTP